MRLVSFEVDGKARYGVVSGDGVVDMTPRLGERYGTLLEVLQRNGQDALRRAATDTTPDFALNDVTLARPIPYPEKIICIGVNYFNRNEEYRDDSDRPKYPSVFMRTPDSLTGHGAPLLRPPESEQLDYEGEIAIVIGKPGRRIPKSQAESHIAGITCFNEGSVRDWLRHGKFNVTQGKNFVGTGAIGPWIVTSDEVENFDDLRVTTRVNGDVRQDDSTANLLFPFRYLINYLSTFYLLKPGDIVATGTPTGAGARFDPPRWLRPGDVVEVEVSGVGTLRNEVQDEDVPA